MSYRKSHINPKIKGLRKKKKFFQMPLFWIFLLIVIIAGGIVYAIFWMPFVQVSLVEISGNQKIQTDEIEKITWDNIHKKMLGVSYGSIFMVNTLTISNAILAALPVIESVNVQKKLPDHITVMVKEREPYGIFCVTSGECFVMDEHGVVFEPYTDNVKDNFVVRQSTDSQKINLGQSMIDKHVMDGIVLMRKDLKDTFGIEIKEVAISDQLVVTTKEDWKAYIDPAQDIGLQITKMNLLLKDQISENARKKLEYIYLQYKDRAYYK